MRIFNQNTEVIECEDCRSKGKLADPNKPVIEYVNMKGEPGEKSIFNPHIAEIATLPKARLCSDHARERRKWGEGHMGKNAAKKQEWVPIADAVKMITKNQKAVRGVDKNLPMEIDFDVGRVEDDNISVQPEFAGTLLKRIAPREDNASPQVLLRRLMNR